MAVTLNEGRCGGGWGWAGWRDWNGDGDAGDRWWPLLWRWCRRGRGGQEEGSASKTWRGSLEADIRNRRDAAGICQSAKIYASSSTDVSFKDWAYGIANQYCAMAEESATAGDGDKPSAPPPAPIPERPQIVNGITVPLCSSGMPCLGQLRRAMGIWE